jgi:hypothetical protein
MTIAKHLLSQLIAQIRKELTIQKPAYVARPVDSRQQKSSKGADAVKGILILIIAPVIFCILSIMVL